MLISNGFHVTVVVFVLLTFVEKLSAIKQKTGSLHKSSKVASNKFKSDLRLTADLDKTLNTFKRKDHIDKKAKASSKKVVRQEVSEKKRIKNEDGLKDSQKLNVSETPLENNKRQYIYGAPQSMISPEGLTARRFVAYPKPGLPTGCRLILLDRIICSNLFFLIVISFRRSFDLF